MFNYSKLTRRFISPPNRMFARQTTSSTCMIYTYGRSLCGRVCTRFLCFSTIPRGNNIITTKIQNDYNTADTFFNSSQTRACSRRRTQTVTTNFSLCAITFFQKKKPFYLTNEFTYNIQYFGAFKSMMILSFGNDNLFINYNCSINYNFALL